MIKFEELDLLKQIESGTYQDSELKLSDDVIFSERGTVIQNTKEKVKNLFKAISNLPKLKKLTLERNLSEILDKNQEIFVEFLKTNKNLTSLDISPQQPIDGQIIQTVMAGVAQNKSLTSLSISNFYAGNSLREESLFEGFAYNTTIRTFTLEPHRHSSMSENRFFNLNTFGKILKFNKTLTSLNLKLQGLVKIGNPKALHEDLRVNKTLQSLDITGCALGGKIVDIICDGFKNHPTLHSLNLWGNNLDHGEFTLLVPNLQTLSKLNTLGLRNNKLDAHDIKILTEQFIVRNVLTELDLAGNPFEHDELDPLIESLKRNNNLKTLSLRGRGLNEKTLNNLALALTNNKTLTNLDLCSSKLTTEISTQAIIRLLKNNTVVVLELHSTGIGTSCAAELATALTENSSLRTLKLGGYHFDTADPIKTIMGGIKDNKSIEELQLTSNRLTLEDVKLIAEMLRNNSHLTSLILTQSCVSVEGLQLLLDALNDHKSLRTLGLVQNGRPIGGGPSEGFKNIFSCLKRFLENNQTITEIDLKCCGMRFNDENYFNVLLRKRKMRYMLSRIIYENCHFSPAITKLTVSYLELESEDKLLEPELEKMNLGLQAMQLCDEKSTNEVAIRSKGAVETKVDKEKAAEEASIETLEDEDFEMALENGGRGEKKGEAEKQLIYSKDLVLGDKTKTRGEKRPFTHIDSGSGEFSSKPDQNAGSGSKKENVEEPPTKYRKFS